ncbi:MAG: radical SAM protein [Sedimentisphaerales bacterium]|nr:radical SAM protein [Sedimentisphaerales bacterium]
MINITRLYCDQVTPGDWLRYGQNNSGERPGETVPKQASQRRPIVVWNITRVCNLKCLHCYNDSGSDKSAQELTTDQAKSVLDNLAEFGVPSVLFSGGEPLMRPDLFELIAYARDQGLRAVISTNGTLIDAQTAQLAQKQGVSYVGVSLDGIGPINDKFRGIPGAFDRAVAGIRHCQDIGLRVGLRLTLTKTNIQDLDKLFQFFENENIERACFYHLVPTGRAGNIADQQLTHNQTRAAVQSIMDHTKRLTLTDRKTDILTVDNHTDGVFLYLTLLKQDPEKAAAVWKLLTWNGGGLYSSGVGIACIDFNGFVHPDQFWYHYNLGNVQQKPFSQIWTNPNEPLLNGLRSRRQYIKGRCRLCKFFDACGGSLRVRADLHFKNPWAPDPACYLTDKEIGLDPEMQKQLQKNAENFPMPE